MHDANRIYESVDLGSNKSNQRSLQTWPSHPAPNVFLRWLHQTFLGSLKVEESWLNTVREAAQNGTVVYALRSLSLFDFWALDALTRAYALPPVRFANNLGLWLIEPFDVALRHTLRLRTQEDDLAELRAAIESNNSVAVFLKRPPSFLVGRSFTGRGLLAGDDFIRELIEIQRQRHAAGNIEKPILIVPQLFVWSRRPDTTHKTWFDVLIGTREWPSILRSTGQFLMNSRNVIVRAGEPLNFEEFLQHEGDLSLPQPMNRTQRHSDVVPKEARDDSLVRRAVFSLLRRIERERRVILGPVLKPSSRLIDEVIRSPRLRKVMDEFAGEGKPEQRMVEARTRAMLRAMAAAPEADIIHAIGTVVEQVFRHIFDAVEFDHHGIQRIRDAASKGNIVLLPAHKSHVDYILLSYVLWKHKMQTPIIAAGENLAFFPIGVLLRRAGAFFIRRKIGGDRLYASAFEAYVHKLVREGFPLEFFIEGGRSRTGKLLPPKTGLLRMVVDAAYELPSRPVFFVPISISYERVVEARSYARELAGAEKESENVFGLVRMLRVLTERYGRIHIQIGKILTVNDVAHDLNVDAQKMQDALIFEDAKRRIVNRLAYQSLYEINQATAVTAGSLTAMALLTQASRGISRETLMATCDRLITTLIRLKARIPERLRSTGATVSQQAIEEAIKLFSYAGWVEIHAPIAEQKKSRLPFLSWLNRRKKSMQNKFQPGEVDDEIVYVIPAEKRTHLDFSRNAIIHFFVPYALVSTALLMSHDNAISVRVLRDRVQGLSRLFKFEFMFRADLTFEEIFEDTLKQLIDEKACIQTALNNENSEEAVKIAESLESHARVELYASTLVSFLEGYRIAARSLTFLARGSGRQVVQKELIKKALSIGKNMFLSGEITRYEAIARSLIENAIRMFLDQGYIVKNDGKLSLAASFATVDAVRILERRIVAYLPQPSVHHES